MKLLQVIAGSRHGGAEEFFVRLASAIGYRSVEQKIIMRPNRPASGTVIHWQYTYPV